MVSGTWGRIGKGENPGKARVRGRTVDGSCRGGRRWVMGVSYPCV